MSRDTENTCSIYAIDQINFYPENGVKLFTD